MGRRTSKPVIGRDGATLAVVLWALVALGALSIAAALVARVEIALSANHRDYAAALALAEVGLAEALAREAADPGPLDAPRSVAGTVETGSWSARWTPIAGRFAVRATGRSGRVPREIEAWIEVGAPGGPRIVAWREVR